MRIAPQTRLTLAVLLALAVPQLARAAILQVDDNNTECPAAGYATIALAVAAASATDTIQVCPGTYAEAMITVNKALTITGLSAGVRATTIVTVPGIGFKVAVGGVTISHLTLQMVGAGTEGVRYEANPIDTPFAGAMIDDVAFLDFSLNASSRGIEVHDAVMNDLTVQNSYFEDNTSGIRMSSMSQVDGLHVTGSTFIQSTPLAPGAAWSGSGTLGIYQANDGGTSSLRDLQASGNTFSNMGNAGIYAEEIRDSVIENNTFTGNAIGIYILKWYTAAGVLVENVQIAGNTFTNQRSQAVNVSVAYLAQGLGAGLIIERNTINEDVGVLNGNRAMIFIGLRSTLTHAPVLISRNEIRFSGTYLPGVVSAYGINLNGNGEATIEYNVFDGANVGGSGDATNPPQAAVYIRSNSVSTGFSSGGLRTNPVTIRLNCITDFVHGVTVFATLNSQPGGLTVANVTVSGSNIVGNSPYGIFNGGTSATISAPGDWWGDPSGPSGSGPGTGDAISTNVSASAFRHTPQDCDLLMIGQATGENIPVTGLSGMVLLGLALALAGAYVLARIGR